MCRREFYYIQMEKYSRQLLAEGVVNADDIHVSVDSELFRALNLHYNRNNHIEVMHYLDLLESEGVLTLTFDCSGSCSVHLRRFRDAARVLQSHPGR